MSAHRDEKIIELLKHLAAQYLQKESSGTSLITVTNATVSPDGKYATIFFTVLPAEKEEAALDFTKRKRSEFKAYVRDEARIRVIPFIDFQIDLGEKNRQRIDEISQN